MPDEKPVNDKPEDEIGELYHFPDYEREVNGKGEYKPNLAKTKNGKPLGCDKIRTIDWKGEQKLKEEKKCEKLSGAEIQIFINQNLKMAQDAALEECKKTECKFGRMERLRYRSWECKDNILKVHLQFLYTCLEHEPSPKK